MGLADLTEASAVVQAIAEFDRLGRNNFLAKYGFGKAKSYFHTVALADSGSTRTRLSDLALLCSNCHRMIHRRRPFASIDELRQKITPSEEG